MKCTKALLISFLGFLLCASSPAFGVSVLKDFRVVDASRLEVFFDSAIAKENIRLDAFQQIIQLSIENSSVYPAKIKSLSGAWSKVFIYQYSPTLVRLRLTVEGNAEEVVKRFQFSISGKQLSLSMKPLAERVEPKSTASLSETSLSEKEQKIVQKLQETPANTQVNAKAKTARGLATGDTKKATEPLAGNPPQLSWKKSFGMLFAVLGLFLLIAFAVKRLNFSPGLKNSAYAGGKNFSKQSKKSFSFFAKSRGNKSNDWIKPLATHVLGPQQSISVVKIRGRTLVLGVTSDSIKVISQINSDQDEAMGEDELPAEMLNDLDFTEVMKNTEPPKVSTSATFSNYEAAPANIKKEVKRNTPSANSEPVSAPKISQARQRIQNKLGGLREL